MRAGPDAQGGAERLRGLIEAPLRQLGLTLLEVSWSGGRRGPTLRVTVDRPGGVTVDECGAASLAISELLDVREGELPEHYLLEVSSPGAERLLAGEEELRASLGRRVRVRLRAAGQDAVVEGRLIAVSEQAVELEARRRSGRPQRLDLARSDIMSVQVVVDL